MYGGVWWCLVVYVGVYMFADGGGIGCVLVVYGGVCWSVCGV